MNVPQGAFYRIYPNFFGDFFFLAVSLSERKKDQGYDNELLVYGHETLD